MDRTKVRQLAVYVDPQFLRKIEREARDRRRKLGPTVLEILREYFEKKEAELAATAAVEKAS